MEQKQNPLAPGAATDEPAPYRQSAPDEAGLAGELAGSADLLFGPYGSGPGRAVQVDLVPPMSSVAAAGLPKGFGFHGLRHYYATVLIHGGASVKTVQLALGHTTPTITLNTYVGHWPDAVDTTRALVDSALSRPCRPLAVAR